MEMTDLLQRLVENPKVNIEQLLSDVITQIEQFVYNASIRFSVISKVLPLLKTVQNILEANAVSGAAKTIDWNSDDACKKITKLCFEILQTLQPSVDNRRENLVLLSQTCSLLHICVVKCDLDLLEELLDWSLKSLHYHVTERTHVVYSESTPQTHSGNILDIFCSLEVVKTVLLVLSSPSTACKEKLSSDDTNKLSNIFDCLLRIAYNFESKPIVHLTIQSILQFFKLNDGKATERLLACWENIQQFWTTDYHGNKPSMMLCSLANEFLPVDGNILQFDIRTSELYWIIIQRGLSSKDTLVRKQCMYLLKRTVDSCQTSHTCVVNATPKSESLFFWDVNVLTELSKVWEDFIMIIETFEEKQVHVIKPLLPRIQNLIQATEQHQGPLLHTSWLTVLIKRALTHESIFIVRWAVDTMLSVDMSTCPMMQQNQDKYLSSEFLVSIQDAKLYYRSQDSAPGSCPSCAEGLIRFFKNCWHALETKKKQAEFFGQVLETLSSNSWGPAPFLYICQALSHVPESPLLDAKGILNLRKTMTANQATVYSYLRGAIQSFCAETLIHLADMNEVLPTDVCSVLSVFSHEESLQRETTLWTKFVCWLKSASNENLPQWTNDNIRKLLSKQVSDFLQVKEGSSFSFEKSETTPITRLCLMAADAGLLPLTAEPPTPSLSYIVTQMTDIINAITTHPYMSPHKAEKAVELLLGFLQELGQISSGDEVGSCVTRGLNCCAVQMLIFIRQRLTDGWKEMKSFQSIHLCEKAVGVIIEHYHDNDVISHVILLIKTSIEIYRRRNKIEVTVESQMPLVGTSCMLGAVARAYTTWSLELNPPPVQNKMVLIIIDFVKDMEIILNLSKPPAVDSHKEWGKITSTFLSNQWQLLLLCLKCGEGLKVAAVTVLDMCLESFSLMGGKSVLSNFQCIQHLLPSVVAEGETSKVESVMDQGWSCVKENMTGTRFFSIFTAFVNMVFQSVLFRQPENSSIIAKLLKYCSVILTLGEEKSGVSSILVSQLCKVWSIDGMLPHMYKFYQVMVDACLYGPVHKKHEKQQYEMDGYLETLGSKCSVNDIMTSIPKDYMVRVCVVNLLCKLRTNDDAHVKLVQGLLDRLIAKYWDICKVGKGSTFPNSLVHRQKQRLLQTLVLMEPFMLGNYVDQMWTFCLNSIAQEKQPSVRHMIEWLTLRLLCHHGNLINNMWDVFINICETKTIVVCSLLCVISHLGPHLDTKTQAEYYTKAVPLVLPWCMAHHFNSRLHAQAALSKLWDQCQQLKYTDILSKYSLVQSVLNFNQKTNNSTKNIRKLLENYFMATFDCNGDYSIETIFYTLPRLSCLVDDEWIPAKCFSQTEAAWSQEPQRMWLPLLNKTQSLQMCTPGSWRVKTLVSGEEEEEDEGKEGDVQKKIMPWRLMTPDEEIQEELDYCKKRHLPGGLVLVTSLIDKLPNLGGLCRTSEIFGVSEFVIGKMKYLEDKMFQSLSVTAHKWLPITEVYHTKLGQYLTQKKQDGYTLVGVEQTANSIDLTNFQFPQKSLLLLGNEKEGIPVELINLLDVCVEIPQQGIIRSLNVHVSGALLVWEYRRQQLVADQAVKS